MSPGRPPYGGGLNPQSGGAMNGLQYNPYQQSFQQQPLPYYSNQAPPQGQHQQYQQFPNMAVRPIGGGNYGQPQQQQQQLSLSQQQQQQYMNSGYRPDPAGNGPRSE